MSQGLCADIKSCMQKSKCKTAQCELTGGGAAPDVTDDTDESERVGQVSALWITTFKRLL